VRGEQLRRRGRHPSEAGCVAIEERRVSGAAPRHRRATTYANRGHMVEGRTAAPTAASRDGAWSRRRRWCPGRELRLGEGAVLPCWIAAAAARGRARRRRRDSEGQGVATRTFGRDQSGGGRKANRVARWFCGQ
jgi:hypothetical protein